MGVGAGACSTAASAIVFAGSSPHGQGHETIFAQIASDELGMPFDRVEVRTDTATVLQGIGTMGSRGVPTSRSAVKVASQRVLDRAKRSPPTIGRLEPPEHIDEGNLCRCTGYEMIVRSVRWAIEHRGERSS